MYSLWLSRDGWNGQWPRRSCANHKIAMFKPMTLKAQLHAFFENFTTARFEEIRIEQDAKYSRLNLFQNDYTPMMFESKRIADP